MIHVLTIHAYPNNYLVSQLQRVAQRVSLIVPHEFESTSCQMADELQHCDLDDQQALLALVSSIHKQNPISAIVPIYEGSVVNTAIVACELGLKHIPVEAARLSRDKFSSYQCWYQAQLPVPLTFPVGNSKQPDLQWEQSLPYPVIVKPVDAMSSQGVVKVTQRSEYLQAVEHITAHLDKKEQGFERALYKFGQCEQRLVVQEFCKGEEVGIDLYINGKNEALLGTFQKANAQGPYFPESMSITPSCFDAAQEQALFDIAVSAVRALGVECGVAHVEIRMTELGPKILEAGLRPGGAYTAQAIELITGMSSLEVQARLYLDLPILEQGQGDIGAVLYGGVLYPNSGTLIDVKGLDVFNSIKGMKEVKQLNKVGDSVRAMPNSSQPHLLYYLLSSSDREDALKAHEKIQSQISAVIV